eukprot:m.19638 g.19638  ORF g.19638 m.19638 type:complete len:376 (+) comp6637_c0_seq2:184-1311(+)
MAKSKGTFDPVLREYTLMAEYKLLQQQKIGGVYVQMSQLLVWDAMLFLRSGLYNGAVFRFKILLPKDFPSDDTPRVFFQSQVYHPQITPNTYEFHTKHIVPEWNSKCRIWHIVKAIKKQFYTIDCQEPLNAEAAQLHETNLDKFSDKAQESVMLSIKSANTPSCSAIRFDAHMPRPDLVLEAMLDWGATGALSARRLREITGNTSKKSSSPTQEEENINFKQRLRSVRKSEIDALRTMRVIDTGCRGWLSLLDQANWERRWCVLDARKPSSQESDKPAQPDRSKLSLRSDSNNSYTYPQILHLYENEQERKHIQEFHIEQVCNAYQPDIAELKANNTFIVVLLDTSLQFRADSEKEVKLWLEAINMCSSQYLRRI